MKPKFRIHLLLIRVEDEGSETEKTDILEEEEFIGYRADFVSEGVARNVYSILSGVDVRHPDRQATSADVRTAVAAYRDGVMADSHGEIIKAFDPHDAEQVVMALSLRGVKASEAMVMEAADQMRLT